MHQRTIRFILARLVAVGTLVVAPLLLASPGAASVVDVESIHFTRTVTNANPCAPEDGPVTLTFEVHGVIKQLADGTFLTHGNYHGTGSSTSGTEYVVNRQEWFTTDASGNGSGTATVERISKGSVDNTQLDVTFTFEPLTVSMTFRCMG
jgi:hypothetical protein